MVTWKNDEKEFDKLLKRMKSLEMKQVDVGFFNTTYSSENGGLSVAQVAQWQEEGTIDSGGHIPARPFIRTGFHQEVMSKYKAPINKALSNVASGTETPHAMCKRLGAGLQTEMQLAIENGSRYKANSVAWAAFKQSTTGASSPLIYTGKMRDSVKYRITNR